MKKADYLIVGGGVVGASIAYHLTERGAKNVCILERESRQGLGSTGKATGGVRAQFETEINIKMSLYSLEFLSRFEEATGVDCGYEPRGYLFLANSWPLLDYLRTNVERQRALGVDDVELVDRQTIAEIVPGMNNIDLVGGSFCRRDGFIDPLGVMRGFCEKAVERGAEVIHNADVSKINVTGGKVVSLETTQGTIETENVICAAGAWAADVAKTAGIELPVKPLRRQIVWAKSETLLPENLPMVIDLANGFHFRPARGSRRELLFAYPDPDETAGMKTDFDDGFIDRVLPLAKARAPFLSSAAIMHEKCRAGLYEMTPDHHPIIGGCDVAGLYFASGFSGHGVMHSPASGRAIAEIVLDGKASFLDVSSLSLERFLKGQLLRETSLL